MRQPQLGGVYSRKLAVTTAVCTHGNAHLWRLGDNHKWVCGVCHPPAVAGVEWWAA
jgi:hypothetical protein